MFFFCHTGAVGVRKVDVNVKIFAVINLNMGFNGGRQIKMLQVIPDVNPHDVKNFDARHQREF